MMNRRQFMGRAAALGMAAAGRGIANAEEAPPQTDRKLEEPSPARLPRWRGFNLLEKFMMPRNDRFLESDFAWMAELGFNFARLPMDYRCWTDPDDWTKLREETLKEIDDAVALGRKHGIHLCLNFHRAPGHTVASPPEARSVWDDEEAQRVCALHWAAFAERYAGMPNNALSFNLFNEPMIITAERHRTAVARVAEAIRKHDEQRLIICDGRMWGQAPPEELLDLRVAGSTRGYEPHAITHYQASWSGQWEGHPVPTHPWKDKSVTWDKETLRERRIAPWKALEARGMGVHVGEFGAYNKTPHAVVLAWMRDCLALWQEAEWGWALWNFRGAFGILDSDRADVAYEDWRGHRLDRAMLALLQAY